MCPSNPQIEIESDVINIFYLHLWVRPSRRHNCSFFLLRIQRMHLSEVINSLLNPDQMSSKVERSNKKLSLIKMNE